MIDAGIEQQRVLHVETLVRSTGDADYPRPGPLGQLPGHGTNRAGCGRDHHRLSGLRLADVRHAGIGSGAGHPKHAKIGRKRCGLAIHLHQIGRPAQAVGLPAARAGHRVAGLQRRIGGSDHLTDAFAGHDLTDLHRGGIGCPPGHPAALIGVDRQENRAGDHLTRTRGGDRILDDREITRLQSARWAAFEHDGTAVVGKGHQKGSGFGCDSVAFAPLSQNVFRKPRRG